MNRTEIYEKVCDVLVQDFEIERDKLTYEVNLFEDLDLDSIDAVDLIVRLQKIIQKKVVPEDFHQIRTMNDLLDVLEKIVNNP